jgi:hypothetical protein
MDHFEADRALDRLQILLNNLPIPLPTSFAMYDFIYFSPDPEAVELYGSEEAALNNVLEATFAPKGRKVGPCPFELLEKGPGLVAVVEVLRDVLTKCPTSAIMAKWVEDLTQAAIYQFDAIGQPVSSGQERHLISHSVS